MPLQCLVYDKVQRSQYIRRRRKTTPFKFPFFTRCSNHPMHNALKIDKLGLTGSPRGVAQRRVSQSILIKLINSPLPRG